MDVKGILTLLCLMPVINGINRGTLVGDNLPFIGQLRYKYTNKLFVYECGVSPIGRKNVLTTKGCIHEKPKIDVSQYRVVLGSNQMESGGKTYTVTKIQLHPTVDLALLTVRSQIPENSTLKIDCSSEILVNQSATVYGFGSTSAGYGTHQKLSTQTRKATVKRVRRALCQMNPGLDDNEICMTSTMPRKLDRQNVCYGDAGSPLIGEDNTLHGVVSRGPFLCHNRNPYASYVSMYSVCSWIEEKGDCKTLTGKHNCKNTNKGNKGKNKKGR